MSPKFTTSGKSTFDVEYVLHRYEGILVRSKDIMLLGSCSHCV